MESEVKKKYNNSPNFNPFFDEYVFVSYLADQLNIQLLKLNWGSGLSDRAIFEPLYFGLYLQGRRKV